MRSFVFYESWWIAIANLSRDIQGEVLTAIVEYGLTGSTTERQKPIANAILSLIKGQMDCNNAQCEEERQQEAERHEKYVRAGRLGGEKRWKEKAKSDDVQDSDGIAIDSIAIKRYENANSDGIAIDSIAIKRYKQEQQEENEEKERTKEKEDKEEKKEEEKKPNTYVLGKKESAKRFQKPSLDEVKAYWNEKVLQGNPEQFYDHFTSNGWLVSGRTPMKDWRAAARYWGRNSSRYSASSFSRPRNMNDPYQNGQILIGSREYSTTSWDVPDHTNDGSIPLSEINNAFNSPQK